MHRPIAPGLDAFPPLLAQLQARLDARTASEGPAEGAARDLATDLGTAYEELRVADAEVRSQRGEIERIRTAHAELGQQHERVLAALPVAAVTTDSRGVVRGANSTAAELVGVSVPHLTGKPLPSLLHPDHRREVRDLLSSPPPGTTRTRSVLETRSGPPVEVALTLLDPGDEPVRLTWLVLPAASEDWGGADLVPEVLVQLVGLPAQEAEVQDVLAQAAALCSRALGDLHTSITMGHPAAPQALASTSGFAQAVDGAQVAAGEGPCVAAFETHRLVVAPDVAGDPRWPRLGPTLPVPTLSAVAAPVEVGPRLVGALNVYGAVSTFEPWVAEATELLAATLGAVFYELELTRELIVLSQHMERALASRATIEQAKGIIMGQRRCTADEAFEHLRRLSSSRERKVRDVAAEIVQHAPAEG